MTPLLFVDFMLKLFMVITFSTRKKVALKILFSY